LRSSLQRVLELGIPDAMAVQKYDIRRPVSDGGGFLNVTVHEMEHMLRRIIGEEIDSVTVLQPDLGRVKVDPGQMEQVIMNLVLNARDAMASGGRLTIESADVELDEGYVRRHLGTALGPHGMLAVTDNGVGMDH
jgi:signal transduction histidine kinase